jgi:uncharacterized protein YciI
VQESTLVATTEPCFVAECVYAKGAAEKRAPFREQHLARVGMLSDEGALLLAGAFDDMSASLLVFAVDSEDAAVAIIETDVYWKNKVWTSYKIRRLNRVVLEDQ